MLRILIVVLIFIAAFCSCEQDQFPVGGVAEISDEEETTPLPPVGVIKVVSLPEGAQILIDGEETGKITPYAFDGLFEGVFCTVTLVKAGYRDYRRTVVVRGTYVIDAELAALPPEFVNWRQDPVDLTEESEGRFRISLEIVEKAGGGLAGKIPQLAYQIIETLAAVYKDMTKGHGDVWYYDIPEPPRSWMVYSGRMVRYRVIAYDITGAARASEMQEELIDKRN